MSLHPNWVALSTVDFSWKSFVRERNLDIVKEKISKPKVHNESLNGTHIKDFYLNIVSGPEQTKNKETSRCFNNEKEKELKKCVDNEKSSACTSSRDHKHINASVINAFMRDSQNNSVEDVKKKISIYPEILNSKDDFGWTGLMCAVQSNAVETVDYLLECGADKNVMDLKGRTVFSLCKNKHIKNLLSKNYKCEKICNDLNKNNEPKILATNSYCQICKQNYKGEEKDHSTSTLHIFYLNKKKKPRTFYGIPECNKGYQLLLKTGWNREKGLGPDGLGLKFPLKTILKADRHGFGNETSDARVTHFNSNDPRAIKHRKETQRFLNKKQREKKISKEKMYEKCLRLELS